jgi:hypothetical protein
MIHHLPTRIAAMAPTFKELTAYFTKVGADQVSHTEKSYVAHAIGVYTDLKEWGFDEDFARIGLFHSIYGTQLFQGFTLPLEKRGEIRDMIGEYPEHLVYVNCAMDRDSFDAQVPRREAPYAILDRFTSEHIEQDEKTFDDLVSVHLCDWLEQVERSESWDYRRNAFETMAERLGGIGAESFARTFAKEPQK